MQSLNRDFLLKQPSERLQACTGFSACPQRTDNVRKPLAAELAGLGTLEKIDKHRSMEASNILNGIGRGMFCDLCRKIPPQVLRRRFMWIWGAVPETPARRAGSSTATPAADARLNILCVIPIPKPETLNSLNPSTYKPKAPTFRTFSEKPAWPPLRQRWHSRPTQPLSKQDAMLYIV